MNKKNDASIYDFYNTYAIDSTKLRLDFDKIKLGKNSLGLDKNISEVVIDEDFGEFEIIEVEPKRKNMIKYNCMETQVRFIIVNKNLRGVFYKHLYIFFSAKILDNYLAGITIHNIKEVYNKIMELEVISISFKDFSEGYLVDTDIKFDSVNDDPYKLIKSIIRQRKIGVLAKTYGKKRDESVYFNDRDKSSKTKPYFGFYIKNLDMKKKENEMLSKRTKNLLPNTVRLELTISGAKMFEGLELPNTLMEFLKVLDEDSQLEIESEIDKLLSKVIYDFGGAIPYVKAHRLNYDKLVIINLIARLLEEKQTEEEVLSFLIDGITFKNKETKSRYKDNMNFLIHNLIVKENDEIEILPGVEIRAQLKSKKALKRAIKKAQKTQ